MFGVQQEDCSTNAVPGRRNCGRRSSSYGRYQQWRRDEFESGGEHRSGAKEGDRSGSKP